MLAAAAADSGKSCKDQQEFDWAIYLALVHVLRCCLLEQLCLAAAAGFVAL